MRKIIHNLRQQPEEVRRTLLHIITFFLALILFALWIYSLGGGFRQEDVQVEVRNDSKDSPGLEANVLDGYEDIQ